MDVSEDMEPRAEGFNRGGQIIATGVHGTGAGRHAIENPRGRPVGDQDVGVRWNLGPAFGKGLAALEVKGPAEEHRRPRTAPEFQAGEFQPGVLQIVGMPDQGPSVLGFVLETPVMIAGDQDLVGMGLLGEPVVEILKFGEGAHAEAIAGMNQNVAFRYVDLSVHAVGIGDTDQPHILFLCAFLQGGHSPCFYDSIAFPEVIQDFSGNSMRLILSRKGFDSSAGGCPSPMLPDGSLCALPIPDRQSRIRYDQVHFGQRRLGKIARDLTGGRITGAHGAHLDPDLVADAFPRADGWRPVLGQTGSAQGHLRNQGVTRGDLFLFFGVFRQAELWQRRWRFVPGTRPFHSLWGWLHVGEVHGIDGLEPGALPWARYHPHFHGAADPGNTLYVASERFEMPGQAGTLAGSGVFCRGHDALVLTDPEARLPTRWRLPSAFFPGEGRPPLSYHTRAERWRLQSPYSYLQSAARGQEFVLDLDAYPGVAAWAAELLRTGRDDRRHP